MRAQQISCPFAKASIAALHPPCGSKAHDQPQLPLYNRQPCRRGEYAKVQYHPCELLDEQSVRQIAANWMHRLPRRFAARIQAHWKRQTRPRVRLNPKIAAIWIKEPFPKSLSVLS